MSKAIVSTISLVIGLGAAPLHAAPDKVIYELQERCATRSEVFFKHLGYGGDVGYENHYNPELKRLLLLVRW